MVRNGTDTSKILCLCSLLLLLYFGWFLCAFCSCLFFTKYHSPFTTHLQWRACRNSLPVNYVHMPRHMSLSNLCTCCNEAPETVLHALFTCACVRDTWNDHLCCQLIFDAPKEILYRTI